MCKEAEIDLPASCNNKEAMAYENGERFEALAEVRNTIKMAEFIDAQ